MKPVAFFVIALPLAASSLAFAQGAQDPSAPPPPVMMGQPPVMMGQPPVMMGQPPVMMGQPQLFLMEEPPSRGIGYLVTGGILTGLGGLNLLLTPLCLEVSGSSYRDACVIASLSGSIAFVGVGVPLLVVGAGKRSAFKRWKAANPWLAGLDFSTSRSAGALTWTARF